MNTTTNDSATGTSVPTDPIRSLDLDRLAELMRMRGYRVERLEDPAGGPLLRSATGGFAFEIRPGTPLPAPLSGFGDFTCHAALKVEGVLDQAVINMWNSTRRYARMYLMGDMLVLSQDVSVLGGIDPAHLFMQLEVWDRQVQDLPAFLRAELARLGAAAPQAANTVQPAALAS